MTLTKESVLKTLAEIKTPEGQSLVARDLIRAVVIREGVGALSMIHT